MASGSAADNSRAIPSTPDHVSGVGPPSAAHSAKPGAGAKCGISPSRHAPSKPASMAAASKMLANYTSPFDATVVERLAAAGAVSLGKLNCDEFAMGSGNENSAFGAVRNPWDRLAVPGGSSGGMCDRDGQRRWGCPVRVSAAACRVRPCCAAAALRSDTGGQSGAARGERVSRRPAARQLSGRRRQYGMAHPDG